MKTTVREDRLLVISDVHMGNPLHRPGRRFMAFLQFALDNRYSICINGDGIDIAQLSLSRLHADLTPSLNLFMGFASTRRRIYHTVGNHDIALEHFLSRMGRIMVVPFLNVLSGDKRIRIEHGHMYDGMFIRFPRTYFLFTMIGRLAIGISPKVYDALHVFNLWFIGFAEKILSVFGAAPEKSASSNAIEGERECFRQGAEDVGMRGFDYVVFGHTHMAGSAELPGGVQYYNTGGWFGKPYCVAIDKGRVWYGMVDELLENGDPFARDDVDADTEYEDEDDYAARTLVAAR